MYQLTNTNNVKRLSDGASIPADPTLYAWAEYQDWLKIEGNYPLPLETTTKAAMWEKIKVEREHRENGGYLVGGIWYHSDSASLMKYNTILGRARDENWPAATVVNPSWKDMSGNFAPMTVEMLRNIRNAGILKVAQIFAVAEAHRVAMEASATPETYDFTVNWPPTYQAQ